MAGNVKASKKELSTVIREMRMTFQERLTLPQTCAIAVYMYSYHALIPAELEQIQAEQKATSAASCLLDYVEKKDAEAIGVFVTALQSPKVRLGDLAKEISVRAADPLHGERLLRQLGEEQAQLEKPKQQWQLQRNQQQQELEQEREKLCLDKAEPYNEQPQADVSLPTQPTELKRKFRRARSDLINQLDQAAVMHIVDELYSQERICVSEKQKIESHQTLQSIARSLIDVVDSRGDDVIRLFLKALKSEHIRRADLAQKVENMKLN